MELLGDCPGDPGITHAEHCCFIMVAEQHINPEDQNGRVLIKYKQETLAHCQMVNRDR